MNTKPQQSDARFDRLVDGELSPTEFRELLGSLDEQPGGWRQCALAFVEAQALRCELPLAIRPAPEETTAVETLPSTPPSSGRGGGSGAAKQAAYYLALAASVGAAFYLGNWSNTVDTGRSQLAQSSPAPTSVAAPSDAATQPPGARKPAPIGSVQLVMDGGDADQQPVNMPVFDAKDLGANWQASQQPAIPPHLVEQLKQAGHRVDRQEQWMRVQLDDGRQLYVPIEEYRISPATSPVY